MKFNIKRGNTEFWTLDYDGELIGELYVFYDLEDKDFADGKKTTAAVIPKAVRDRMTGHTGMMNW